jgi:hypothetical protein
MLLFEVPGWLTARHDVCCGVCSRYMLSAYMVRGGYCFLVWSPILGRMLCPFCISGEPVFTPTAGPATLHVLGSCLSIQGLGQHACAHTAGQWAYP